MKPALFKIKDASGNWVEIPALIGRKGDPGTSVTHRWNGTTLYITSESGTTSSNLIGPRGDKGDKGDKGDPFTIAKVYNSVDAMNQGYATDDVPIGGFVAIETGDINNDDNGKLYVKGAAAYEYLTDLSGASGLTGPQGEKGDTGDKGEKGDTGDSGVFIGSADDTPPDTAQVWIVADGDYGHVEKWKFTPADGEPIEKNIIVPPDQALVGIKFRTENGGWVEVPALVGKDGENGISVTHAWNGTVLTLTSASGTTMTDLVGPQGEKGDKGATGDRGEQGYSGVHVGSDDPPEGTIVWIDTGKDYGSIEEWEFTKEGSSDTITKRVIVPPEKALVGLKVLQPDGVSWAEVPALVGEKGDKGDPGPAGPAGSDASVTLANIKAALGYTPANPTTINAELNKKANDFSIELYNGTSGNPKPVRFASFNYSTCDSENGIAAKISMVSGHGNGSSYAFLQDAIIRVNHLGNVTVDSFKYYGASAGTYDRGARQYGDIFWLIDETNKIVDFYCLMGQYARMYQTPWKRLTSSTGGSVTQHTSCTVYSSGTMNWANNSEITLMSDIPHWAMEPTKPTYTAAEVGARPNTWIPSAADIGIQTETWRFTLEDGTIVQREVHVG